MGHSVSDAELFGTGRRKRYSTFLNISRFLPKLPITRPAAGETRKRDAIDGKGRSIAREKDEYMRPCSIWFKVFHVFVSSAQSRNRSIQLQNFLLQSFKLLSI